ncbi:MAG TPA: vWA domain-containing protein, partial [Acidimicrobiia bacterium]|nr:vWA domain-containing protein [Acidimicrobiia bacterium]
MSGFARFARGRTRRLVFAVLAAVLALAQFVVPGALDPAGAAAGTSTANQTITVTNSTGAGAPNLTYRLERCSETTGTNCTGATAVGTASGSNNASGDSGALGNGSSWFWGSATALDYGRNYRLSVITALPASNWTLSGRACNPNGDTASNSGTTAIVIRLANSGNDRRATCTFTYETSGGTITARKGGLRNTGTNDTGTFASGIENATFEYSPNSNFSAPLNDLCVTPAATDAAGNCVSGTVTNDDYYVREKAAPAGWNKISQIAYGGDAFSQSPLVPYTQQVTVNNSSATTRRFVNRMTNPTLSSSCGLNVSLVLDRSGSITPNAATYASAAKGFVDALANTPSQMKIFSFSESASTNQGTFVSLSTGAGVTSLKSTIDSVYNSTGGGTNWDAGLQQSISSGSNLVLFITDGNPTARNGDTGSTSTVNLEDVEYGIASANSVKNANQTIWAVGVANQGSGGITPTNLELVSGPGDFYTADLNTIADGPDRLVRVLDAVRRRDAVLDVFEV